VNFAKVQLNIKIRNNSSIIQYLKYKGISILFAGDLETPGWDWLTTNNESFKKMMKQGINILIAPHHGHKSGFSKSLFDLTGKVDVIIHSKGSEGNVDGTDVASQYSNYSKGITYTALNNKSNYKGNVLTTRSNGDIFIEIDNNGNTSYWTQKASSNHSLIKQNQTLANSITNYIKKSYSEFYQF
jgi:beta-lactamase superfamily II metal-dependent hydrolase